MLTPHLAQARLGAKERQTRLRWSLLQLLQSQTSFRAERDSGPRLLLRKCRKWSNKKNSRTVPTKVHLLTSRTVVPSSPTKVYHNPFPFSYYLWLLIATPDSLLRNSQVDFPILLQFSLCPCPAVQKHEVPGTALTLSSTLRVVGTSTHKQISHIFRR